MDRVSDCEAVRYTQLYRETLLNDIVPFWMRHGRDDVYGGIGNVVDEAGRTLSHDKFLWSQGRALWTFSALYNRVEGRPEWLEFAHHIYRYLAARGRDGEGRWMYRLDSEGNVLERDTSLYVDGFVMHGLAEYYRATKDNNALRLALETFENTCDRIALPGSYGVAPYVIPEGLKTHGIAMIFSFFYFHLGETAGRQDIRQCGLRLAYEILNDFYVPEKDAVLEFVTLAGEFSDTPPGRACVPGHVIEAMWFLITIFEKTGDSDSVAICCRLIQRHLELGWDEAYGGLRLGLDIDGREPLFWNNAECKPWWVQLEALVATALVWKHTRQAWCLHWHERIRLWAFQRYPVATGEWHQWLTREGAPMASAALPVKDPFHLPRALIYLSDIWSQETSSGRSVLRPDDRPED